MKYLKSIQKRNFLTALLAVSFSVPTVSTAANYYGVDLNPNYSKTFGHWVSSSGRTYKFPIMSQLEQGKTFTGPGLYNYVADGRRSSYKRSLSKACGPMSLLMGSDWYSFIHDSNKNNNYLRSKVASLRAAAGIYSNQNTNFTQLKNMASAAGYTKADTNVDLNDHVTYNGGQLFTNNDTSRINMMKAIVNHVKNRRHVIPLWGANTPVNMAGKYAHFGLIYRVVEYPNRLFSYGNQMVTHGYVHFLDPWTGQRIMRSKKQVMDSFDLVNGGYNKDYLVISK